MSCVAESRALAPARSCLGLALLWVCACGSGGQGNADASTTPADALFSPAQCEIEFGFTHVVNLLKAFPAGEGLDITGDGVPDNHLAKLRPLFNQALEDGFARGTWIFLTEIGNWEGPAIGDDPDVSIVVYTGFDADSPPNPANDFGGDGEFLVDSRQLDVQCAPQSATHGARIEDGVLYANPEAWNFQVEGVGTFAYVDLHLMLPYSEDFSTFDGRAGGAWLPCNMYLTNSPQYVGGTLLGQIVNQFALPDPDIDRDGDGLELFVGDGTTVVECIDGDGTRLPGPDCACDPRIVDGYSVSFQIAGVPASIVGILEID